MFIRQSNPGSVPPTPWGALFLATFMMTLAGHAAGDSPIRSINVTYDGETYFCDAVMFAPVPLAVAWEVLTDFDHMAEWVPNVRESKVLKREGNSTMIEQRGLAKFGAASFPYVTERHIEMNSPTTIRSTQAKGSLRKVESLMTLELDGKSTRLKYHLEIVPSLLASAVMSKSFLEHELAEQFTAIVGEMTRRTR